MNRSLLFITLSAFLFTQYSKADSIGFVTAPDPVPAFGAAAEIGNVEALDNVLQRITGGTFSTTTPGVEVVTNPDGTATVTVDPLAFSVLNRVFEDQGKPQITIVFTKDGETEICTLSVDIETFGATISPGDRAQISSAAVSTNQADAGRIDGGAGTDTSNNTLDPVSTATREFFFYQRLLDLRGPTVPMTLDIFHGSQLADLDNFTHLPADFIHNHAVTARKIDFGFGFFQLHFDLGLGYRVSFQGPGTPGDWELTEGHRWKHQVRETAGYYYLADPASQRVWIFKKVPNGTFIEPAQCLRIVDRNGNALDYTPSTIPGVRGPASVTDGLGRTLSFTYTTVPGATGDARPYLSQVTDHAGRMIQFGYAEANGHIELRSITDALGGVYQFTYDANHFLTGKTMPEGNTPYTQTYEGIADFQFEGIVGAVLTQTDAFGRTFTFEESEGLPGLGEKLVKVTNPDGSERLHFHSEENILTGLVDETGAVMVFTPDPLHDLLLGFTDRDGDSGVLTYRLDSGHAASMTDAKGSTTTFTYTASAAQTFQNPEIAESVDFSFLDLTRIDYADRTFREFTYDVAGNRLTSIDRAGDTVTATYNTRGQPLTVTNDEGGVATITYEGATALIDTATDSDVGVTDYAFDSLSRLETITNPDSTTRTFTYDALDRVVTVTDEEGVISRFAYDANSNLVSSTLAEGTPEEQVYAYDYDLLDRLFRITDPVSSETTFDYDYHTKPVRAVLPDMNTVDFEYDPRRQLIGVTDELDGELSINHTPSELIRRITTPEGRTLEFERDPLGQILKTIDNSGDENEVERDIFSRVTKSSDGLKRVSERILDGEGRVIGREEPTVGTTTYDYDGNGRMTKLTDARGGEWDFGFTPMGRRQSIEDPQNHSETRTYDSRGRLHTVTHPDGVVETLAYFPDSRLQSRTFSDGLVHAYAYDSLNRLTQSSRQLGGQTDTCAYAYDSRSNLTGTTVNGNATSATYDARNRLSSVTYPEGFVVTYTYNARSEVIRVNDSLGNQIDFEYNADRQIVRCTKSNGRFTTYAYDAEGLIAGIDHDIGASVAAVFNAADELSSLTRAGFPADGSGAITDSIETFDFDENSEITNGGFTYDERGRPENATWDSDNRLLSVNNGTPVSYRYDAMGQITSRTEGATTTEYLYNAALSTNPIIGEKVGTAFTRYYIALPGGQILYHIDAPGGTPTVRFHHHGQTGNVRFLTDATGAVTDSYAYDAYGRLLEKNGPSTQHYGYVGRLGVRTDPAASLLHMRQRYYDPAQGRFLSRDPVFLNLMARNGLEANPYHYTAGAPSYKNDASGLYESWWDSYIADNMADVEAIVAAQESSNESAERPDSGFLDREELFEHGMPLVQTDNFGILELVILLVPHFSEESKAFIRDQLIGNQQQLDEERRRFERILAPVEASANGKRADCAAAKTVQEFAIGLDGRLVGVDSKHSKSQSTEKSRFFYEDENDPIWELYDHNFVPTKPGGNTREPSNFRPYPGN